MKSKIVLGFATLATLAGMVIPAVAEAGNRYRDIDTRRGYVSDDYVAQKPNIFHWTYQQRDPDGIYRREAREQRERRERMERMERERREYRERFDRR